MIKRQDSDGFTVAVVGLEFGANFVPIYQAHPAVSEVVICDIDPAAVSRIRERYGVERTFASLDEVLADPTIDAVHLVTGVSGHAAQTIAALESGRHVACAVPMGMTLKEIGEVVEAAERSRRVYMMMETAVYTREFLWAASAAAAGEFGEVYYARGVHIQDMTGWPAYWDGLPPMLYATHAVAPVLKLLGERAKRVRALGAGQVDTASRGRYGNPFSIESALVEVRRDDVVVEILRSLSQVAREGVEAFSIYGTRRGFEWEQLRGERPVLHELGVLGAGRGRPVSAHRVDVPDAALDLPAELHRFLTGGHGGSHPHLVHEFVQSATQGRKATIHEGVAANWTATGIAAHLSAMQGGSVVEVPAFGAPEG